MGEAAFSVNAETCVRCGLCIKDCLVNIIEMRDVPAIAPENAAKCIHCGHCQAICPTASITLDGYASDTLEKIAGPLDAIAIQGLVKSRRSVREYSQESVDRSLLEQILATASYAPTATNARKISYLVINGRENVGKLLQAVLQIMQEHKFMENIVRDTLAGWDRIFRSAPCVLIAHAPEGAPLGEADCATALATLELARPSYGLASCWAGFFTVVCGLETPHILPLPAGNKVFGALMLGKPTIAYKRIPFRDSPRIDWVEL